MSSHTHWKSLPFRNKAALRKPKEQKMKRGKNKYELPLNSFLYSRTTLK